MSPARCSAAAASGLGSAGLAAAIGGDPIPGSAAAERRRGRWYTCSRADIWSTDADKAERGEKPMAGSGSTENSSSGDVRLQLGIEHCRVGNWDTGLAVLSA